MFDTEVSENETFERGMMDDMADLKALEDFEDFDKKFIWQMIPHHQMAIMMISLLLRNSERPGMQKLASGIIENQI